MCVGSSTLVHSSDKISKELFMASSEEDGEIVPECITDYLFYDCNSVPVSFALLPLKRCSTGISDSSSTPLFVCGVENEGIQKVYKKVVAWKFEFSYFLPEIYVLLPKDNIWIKLLRPKKSYEEIIKPALTVVHCLNYVKYNPLETREAVWNHIQKTLSAYEVLPCEDDLLKHLSVLRDTALRDKDVSKSEYLAGFLGETCMDNTSACEVYKTYKKRKFIIDEDDDSDDDYNDDDDDNEEEDGIFDHVCALCDNGGELLCCEGRCIRSFHPTIESGVDSFCQSLGYTSRKVEAIQRFVCKNCQYGRHQCFACGLLGFSEKFSGAAEVFPCVSATCGHFFHPKCVSGLVYPSDGIQAKKLENNIADGEAFICPAHKCVICKQGEDKKVYDLQFAVCRRCPKAYHRKCLPRSITFHESDGQKGIQQRAWDGLLPGRVLIYCMEHKMIPSIGTPRRDHILFPFEDPKEKKISGNLPGKEPVFSQWRSNMYGHLKIILEGERERPVQRSFGDQMIKKSNPLKVAPMPPSRPASLHLPKITIKHPAVDKGKFREAVNIRFVPKEQNVVKKEMAVKDNREWHSRDETKKRIHALVESVDSSFDEQSFIMEHKKKSILTFSSRFDDAKTITEAKVERAVKAVQAALKKLEEGQNIEDAKAICEPGIVKHIFKWKKNIGSYISPFLNGVRYTSFGRHFTKLDKLKEIVNRLRWYVQDGDMIVDFCCGSNDFSCLMKEELQKMGKVCQFKNFDLIQPQNDFNFEKRNWLSVKVGELPEGSNVVMGLNPPFANAYEFLNQALKFRPKLLIVTVPKQTKRLDERQDPYDIIWEDEEILAGKSFYLPGSVNVHDELIEQWNNESPPLYLWSRPDWTAVHKAVALKHGHIRMESEQRVNEVARPDFSNVTCGYGVVNSSPVGFLEPFYDSEPGRIGAVFGFLQQGSFDNIMHQYPQDMEMSTP
ncbi:unnamed protein product [Cuscuta epithymum]|uniref:Zinc finger PHD-type domain-containing protein n=1 Tax=Cuscuta epithymum TaxID=186058 RepID=A0AAV0DGH2_9ASTE|nr:unnamed protein product [Cuscuta epithymum]